VSDNGCGIDPDIADRLFEPFATTREQEGGSGLGLSIVRSIVREHGGEISCESQPGQGTTFSLRFPLAAKSPRRPQESSVSA
jgi:two-component system cell cycle sensor histidine kinase/response regulator CckA